MEGRRRASRDPKFFGALHGQRATKGVFIATSGFTGGHQYADNVRLG